MNKNLTNAQNDYAVFLPATSSFYAAYIGKQRYGNYVDPSRIPSSFSSGVEGLNFLEPEKGEFYYKWCLYSAGHATLDLNKADEKEDMFRNRDRSTSWVLGDSGGFQVAKGVWEADWKDPTCPRAQQKREQVLNWMDTLMDYGMCLDIPAWVRRIPAGRAASGINTYDEAVNGTYINNDWFINNRNGNCKFLNVLQGENHTQSDDWYEEMKKYCDPNVYGDRAFNGWAMGGRNTSSSELVLKRLVAMIHDDLLQQGQHDRMHFLGTSKLEWALLFTDIQRAVRKHHNPDFTITFDCASPFLATANGQIYTENEITDRGRFLYRMRTGVDDKKYATDPRLFKDVVVQDGYYKKFESSPIIDQVGVKDICVYKPGDLNKIGKEGRTSWDSFSYAIQMGHNVWAHINAVQEANRQYDAGLYPSSLIDESFDRKTFRDIIEAVVSESDKVKALDIIKKNEKFFGEIKGLRGKKDLTSVPMFHQYFVEEEPSTDSDGEFSEEEEQKLDELEGSVDDA